MVSCKTCFSEKSLSLYPVSLVYVALKAIDILLNGIHKYSNYPTAYLVLGKAYSLKGQFEDAEDAYREGSNLIYSDSTFDFYMKEIESLKAERLIFNSDRGAAFLNRDNKVTEKDEPIIVERENIPIDNVEEEKINIENEFKDVPNIDKKFEEKLDELASEISSARMPEMDNSKNNNVSTKEFMIDDPMIISDTLAKIYEAQNEFAEAIKVYEKLIIKHPDKKEEYTKRIIDLKSRSDNLSD